MDYTTFNENLKCLLNVKGVRGVLRDQDDNLFADEEITVYVIADEHGIVDRGALFQAEDLLSETANKPVNVIVRALNGRPIEALISNLVLVK